MATNGTLPPACAFALSVLADRDLDPDSVPEEAVEAAEQHIATCVRCLSSPPAVSTVRKKKTRRSAESDFFQPTTVQLLVEEPAPAAIPQPSPTAAAIAPPLGASNTPARQPAPITPTAIPSLDSVSLEGPITCQECRQRLKRYAEEMDNGQSVATLYPAIYDHLQVCETGCLVLLDLLRQEAKANRKYRRRPVRDPFRAIGWELTGFFHGGQLTISPMALSYGTLILLVLFASVAALLAVRWDDARYYHPPVIQHFIPTPDGIGLSDGLKVFDACNAASYQDKRAAAQDMQRGNIAAARRLLTAAMNAPITDTTGCNGAEAAIYLADLNVRQSGHPFAIITVSFDSGPGIANPQGGTDRHALYAAYTQELIGAYIAQAQYNTAQEQTPGAPLLYLVLANTTGTAPGALQVTQDVVTMASATNMQAFGLQASGAHPLLGVLGMGPGQLAQVALPRLCRAGIPLIAPTATGGAIAALVSSTTLYQHCAPGFAFVRFSPDENSQGQDAGGYAYRALHARSAAVFYDPASPTSSEAAAAFSYAFKKGRGARILATEPVVDTRRITSASSTLLADLRAGLQDITQSKQRPDLIFTSLSTDASITLAQDIAALPTAQQPALLIGSEYVQPAALEGLVKWVRQQQLTLPRVYVVTASAARPATDAAWQKQFYGAFCQSFAPPGSTCGGATALDQGALLFGDGVELVANVLASITDISKLPAGQQLVQAIGKESFAGVSGPIKLSVGANEVMTNRQAAPVILGIQSDGSIQIVG